MTRSRGQHDGESKVVVPVVKLGEEGCFLPAEDDEMLLSGGAVGSILTRQRSEGVAPAAPVGRPVNLSGLVEEGRERAFPSSFRGPGRELCVISDVVSVAEPRRHDQPVMKLAECDLVGILPDDAPGRPQDRCPTSIETPRYAPGVPFPSGSLGARSPGAGVIW